MLPRDRARSATDGSRRAPAPRLPRGRAGSRSVRKRKQRPRAYGHGGRDRESRLVRVSESTRITRSKPLVPLFEGNTSCERLGVAEHETRARQLPSACVSATVPSHARRSRAPADRAPPRSDGGPGPSTDAERREHGTWAASRSGLRPGRHAPPGRGRRRTDPRCSDMPSHGASPRSIRLSFARRDPGGAGDTSARVSPDADPGGTRNSSPRSASRRRPRRAPRDAWDSGIGTS